MDVEWSVIPINKLKPSNRYRVTYTYFLYCDAETILSKGKKRVEDVMPIATGHEREELEAELEVCIYFT